MTKNKAVELVIFDMDGVLVDSEDAITKASMASLAEYGISSEYEDFKEFTGMGDDRFIGGVCAKNNAVYDPVMKKRAYEIYVERADEWVEVLPWTAHLLEVLRKTDLKLAVASASDKVKVMRNLQCIGVDSGIFTVIVTGLDVERKKPAPDIFLKAAEKCGVSPDKCLVCEDAVSGVMAAKAAGMTCVAVTTSFTEAELKNAGADYVAGDLMELTDIL